METFIIKYKMRIDGDDDVTAFHENIKNCENLSVMNVYVEHITYDKKKAKVFFDKEEAERVAKMFEGTFQHIAEIVTRGKKDF
jgi:hypothetical protein